MPPSWPERMARVLRVATDAAREGGELIQREAGKLTPRDIQEKGPLDFVTRVDKAAEAVILARIAAAFPDDAILSEEAGGGPPGAEHLWVVDPLDGTNNFIHGISRYAVSIAFATKGRPEVGVIFDPIRNEMFACKRDEGVWLNDVPIGVSRTSDLARATVAGGLPTRHRDLLPAWLEQFSRVARAVGTTRKTGSAALDLACVACGRYDAYWEPRLAPWDMAAGAVLVEAAGGRITDDRGGPWTLGATGIIAANPDLARRLTAIIAPEVSAPHN